MESLSARVVERAVVYPTIRVGSRPGKLLMGVYDANGDYVPGSVLDRKYGETGEPMPRDLFPLVTDAESPEAIYAGPIFDHFGHFLLEGLARTWYAARYPDLPLVWVGQHNWQGRQLHSWQREILEILGLTNPAVILADPSRYATLHVPEIGYRYDNWFHPEHAAFLGHHVGPPQVPGARLWLSRSKITKDVRDQNAEPTERRLREAGWTVLHAEQHSVREQVDQLARAEVIAGEEGSAFHTLMLLRDVSAKRLQIFRRHGPEHRNLHTVGDVRGLDQQFVTLENERVLSAVGRFVSKINPNASEILDDLGVPVPPAPPGPTPGGDRIDRLLTALAPSSFLDVGAPDVTRVVGSTAAVRVAVSPQFADDPRRYADSGIAFYELGLDRYADHFHGDREPFDVIRISGPRFADVMAAFAVSKRLAGDGTIWVLGHGGTAGRAALAIRQTHPGYTAARVLVGRRTVFVARRIPADPIDDASVAALSADEVRRRIRRIPPAGWLLPQPLGGGRIRWC